MTIKGFRVFDDYDGLKEGDPYHYGVDLSLASGNEIKIFYHTGTFDRNGTPIYEGDTLRQKSCEIPFKVEDIVSFLIMCGRYEEKHGTPIFDSLEVVNEKKLLAKIQSDDIHDIME